MRSARGRVTKAARTVATSAEIDVPVTVSFRLETIGGMVKERRLAVAAFAAGLAVVSALGLVRDRRGLSAKAAVLPARPAEAVTTATALALPAPVPDLTATQELTRAPDAGPREGRTRVRAVDPESVAVPDLFRDPGF